jgi:hypothetical protein
MRHLGQIRIFTGTIIELQIAVEWQMWHQSGHVGERRVIRAFEVAG